MSLTWISGCAGVTRVIRHRLPTTWKKTLGGCSELTAKHSTHVTSQAHLHTNHPFKFQVFSLAVLFAPVPLHLFMHTMLWVVLNYLLNAAFFCTKSLITSILTVNKKLSSTFWMIQEHFSLEMKNSSSSSNLNASSVWCIGEYSEDDESACCFLNKRCKQIEKLASCNDVHWNGNSFNWETNSIKNLAIYFSNCFWIRNAI